VFVFVYFFPLFLRSYLYSASRLSVCRSLSHPLTLLSISLSLSLCRSATLSAPSFNYHCLFVQIHFMLLQNRQGKCRLGKWYSPFEPSEKKQLKGEVHRLITRRSSKFTNFIEVCITPHHTIHLCLSVSLSLSLSLCLSLSLSLSVSLCLSLSVSHTYTLFYSVYFACMLTCA
jgi:Clathrin adaptor complex small chain